MKLWSDSWINGERIPTRFAAGKPDIAPEPPAVAKECGETNVGATPLPNSALALQKRQQVKILAIGASAGPVE